MSTASQKWSVKIAAWQKSGLSLAAWCRENSVSYHSAIHWRRRLTGGNRPELGVFVELAVPPAQPISLECNGVLVHVTKGFDPGLLADVLYVLKEG